MTQSARCRGILCAYHGDIRSLLEYAWRSGVSEPGSFDVTMLRSWLASQPPRSWTVGAPGGEDCFVDADPGAVYLLETAKDRLARDFPGYRVQEVDSFLDGVLAALRSGEPPAPAVLRAVTFPLTKWRTGYAPRDVDRLIGELTQLVRGPGSDAGVTLAVRKLVDRIRNCRFGTTWRGGYDEQEVDEFLDRIVESLVQGERGTLQRLAGEARFTTVKLRPGYVMADVDSVLASVERALADLGW